MNSLLLHLSDSGSLLQNPIVVFLTALSLLIRVGSSGLIGRIVLVFLRISWEFAGLEMEKSHALWTPAQSVPKLCKETNMGFVILCWQGW